MNLLQVMAQLEADGWHYRLSSRAATTGLYSATAWKEDGISGGKACRSRSPGDALLAALASAQQLRADRQAQLDARAAGSAA